LFFFENIKYAILLWWRYIWTQVNSMILKCFGGKQRLEFSKKQGKIITVKTENQGETLEIAFIFGKILKANDVVCLDGDLGAGKTVFTAGIAKALGIEGNVPSPTFTVLIEHRSVQTPLFHFDAYRLNGEEEFYDMGFTEYFYDGGICVIEWASNIEGIIDENAIKILILRDKINCGDIREIIFSFPESDGRFTKFVDEVEKHYVNSFK